VPGKNLTRQEAETRSGLVTVEAYDIALDLTDAGDTFTSTTTIRFTCRTPGAPTFLDLIAPRVRAITLNGAELDPDTSFDDSRIALPHLAAANEVTVVADAAWSHTGEGLHRFTDPVDGQTYAYTQFEVADARRVFACFEQPDLKSRLTFHVTAPADWTVISNQAAERVEVLPDRSRPVPPAAAPPADTGADADAEADAVTEERPAEMSRTWHFEPTPVMSTYLAALVAGPYTRWHDSYTSQTGRVIPLSVLVRPSMAAHLDVATVFDITKRGFDYYERAFGVPYPYSTYDQAFVPEYNAGAMENIGLVTLTEAYVFRSKPTQARVDRRTITILHEQAHMWFGDLVTMRWWNDLWLNESFAEFVSHLAAVESGLLPDAWTTFQASEKSWGYRQDQLPSTHPIVADIRDLADVEVNFDGITYAKGASVLRQLVAWVGQHEFLTGVGAYLNKHAWGNATLNDLLTELEVTSGRDLRRWSKVWLEEAGVTTLRPALTARDGRIKSLDILQEVPALYATTAPHVQPSLRPARLAVGGFSLRDHELTREWSSEIDIAGPRTAVVDLAGVAQPDLLLVNDGDLAYAKLRLDEASLVTALEHVADLSDPLARALVWGSLWDATRDGELPARRFAATVLDAVASETNSTVIQTLLNQLRTALSLYCAPADRDATVDQAATALIGLALAAAPGSDSQLQFFKTYAALARSATDLDFLMDVYAGESPLPGLALDTDLSWEVLTALVAAGRKGQDDISAALDADPTTKGRESAAGARAALPQAEAKLAAWITALTDDSITNATQRAVIAGFTTVSDRALLVGFVEPYFDCIERTWANRSREMATNVVEGLYPTLTLNEPGIDIVASTDQWLDQLGDRTPSLRRLVMECRAGVVRALAAQTADHG
jgi:aminopeptidase N